MIIVMSFYYIRVTMAVMDYVPVGTYVPHLLEKRKNRGYLKIYKCQECDR